jgi:hypothetical protein
VAVLAATGQGAFGEPYDAGFAKWYASMEAVFDAVDAAIEDRPYHYVECSRRWGYPTEFSWGTIYVTDSTTQFEVIGF